MKKITASIKKEAMALLKAEYRVFFRITRNWCATQNKESHEMVALEFVVGAFCSARAGFLGMKVATKANLRTANTAQDNPVEAFEIAFSGCVLMGLGVVGL